MKIDLKKESLERFVTPAAAVFLFEGEEPSGSAALLDRASGGLVTELLKAGDFKGKLYATALLYTGKALPARRLILVGLGKRKEVTLDRIRGAFAAAAREARRLDVKDFAASMDVGLPEEMPERIAAAAVEGVLLGLYRYLPYKTVDREEFRELKSFTIVEADGARGKAVRKAAAEAEAVSRAVCFVRDLVSAPGNEMTPDRMAKEAKKMAAGRKLAVKVFGEPDLRKLGMNALLGVARGSNEPPRLIAVEHRGGKRGAAPVVLVGKGITFDSGGISLKPAENMGEMKDDMAGGAAVLGVLQAAADIGLPLNVVGLVPAVENLPDGKAYRPGDVLTTFSGQTVEIMSTDAEGRLILADALAYARKHYRPTALIDMATLTGACVVALGDLGTGLFGTDADLNARIRAAAAATGELVWEMPLWDDYVELIKSDVADWKNTGGRSGGAITAALFLKQFAGEGPWAHLDIAGAAWLKKDRPWTPKGASGIGVRLLVEVLKQWSAPT
ncbi:MAG: leucyl aminopeptidase [Syntrophaceae bacterium]|nr:leucyl aminopeptidase [Syntrophaceae bacterium]